ncbi:glycosyltransferase [Leisingera sp. McT4-56]|uniref:glycosyltransferase n=1 Tax=Leisingera sp. McT4-56 TaxID=2881255 RepID=UPI001CF80C30|nr:glycosyltransferase [Leisingera sp. McT4-56]MCB4457233.1 glycosyltransferase [Leisingera sp. McT4-56]
MKILHLIRSADPEGGGPIEYARVMAEAHAQQGHESIFVTLDDPQAPFLKDFPFQVEAAGPVRGPLRRAPGFGARVSGLLAGADAAVIHGLWTHATTGAYREMKRAGFPWLVFPHGMLDPYFRQAGRVKYLLKQAYWTLFLGRVLKDARAVLFTCQEEKRLARGAFRGYQGYRSKVLAFCAADQRRPEAEQREGRSSFRARLPKLGGRDYLLFLSRIHPKKACDNLIRSFAEAAARHPQLDLVMAGPDQVGWKAELEALADQLGIAGRVHWPGMIKGPEKSAAFAGARAFVLPSHQENFGLVVAEALSAGTPVLISGKVNIWREVVEDGAGLSGPDTVAATTATLCRFLSMPAAEAAEMQANCRGSYEARFSVESAARDLLEAISEAANRG